MLEFRQLDTSLGHLGRQKVTEKRIYQIDPQASLIYGPLSQLKIDELTVGSANPELVVLDG